jgi:hypothetical protein
LFDINLNHQQRGDTKMTREEFNNTHFGANMKAVFGGVTHDVISVDFTEGLLGLFDTNYLDDIFWVYCEYVELVKPKREG